MEGFHLLECWKIEDTLSEGARILAVKQNEVVNQNRIIVEWLGFRGYFEEEDSINRGNYVDLFNLPPKQEQYTQDNLQSMLHFKMITGKSELNSCNFIVIKVDETLGI